MNVPANAILSKIRENREEALKFLETLTRYESPSTEPASQQEIRETIAAQLEELGFRVIRIPGRNSGGMLYARPRHKKTGCKAQMIVGHYDTVWSVGTLDKMPYEIDDNTIYGPGVYDMKVGLKQAIIALKTLRQLDLEPEVMPVLFFNADVPDRSLCGSGSGFADSKHGFFTIHRAFRYTRVFRKSERCPCLFDGRRTKTRFGKPIFDLRSGAQQTHSRAFNTT